MSNPYKRTRSRSPDGDRGRSPTVTDRRNRWQRPSENHILKLATLPPGPIRGALTPEQLDAYAVLFRIEEITLKLQTNSYIPQERSPSPPPEYDSQGKRTNTRAARYKKKAELERHHMIQYALENIPEYVPPSDYKKPARTVEKVFIPVRDYPEINFIGLLLGPRGNTLKQMQQDSGAKVAIRGKGSVKGGTVSRVHNNQEEDLHVLIMADEESKIARACVLVKQIMDKAINAPVGQNELKRSQLRDLAVLNGTLRVQHDDGRPCPICNLAGHRRWACPNKDSAAATSSNRSAIVCRFCGNPGHIERDCKIKQDGGLPGDNNTIDNEISAFMKNLTGTGTDFDDASADMAKIEGPTPDENEDDSSEQPWKKRKGDSLSASPAPNSGQPPIQKITRAGPPGLSAVPLGLQPPAPPPVVAAAAPPQPPSLTKQPHPPSKPPPPPPPKAKTNPPPPPPAPPAVGKKSVAPPPRAPAPTSK